MPTTGNPPFYNWLALIAITAFSLSAVWLWRSDLEWHDQQRLAQLLLIVPTMLILVAARTTYLSTRSSLLLAIIFMLGLLSSLLAEHTIWALIEASRYLGLLALMLLAAALPARTGAKVLLVLLLSVSGIHALQFFLYYAMAFISGIRDLASDILLTGFSNPRFFSQFQALAFPLVAALGLKALRGERKWLGFLIFAILSMQWCIAIVLGSRGLFMAFFCSSAALLLFARPHWRVVSWQAAALAIGTLLYLVGFHLIPAWLEIPSGTRVLLRDGLSARDILWQLALQLTLENPWLGAGPMHFAADDNRMSAHPHQMVLQWTAEWGLPATLLALWLIAKGMLRGLQRVRSSQGGLLDAALWLSLFNALILAQVDGVFVMPYTEVWLAVLAGIALGRWSSTRSISPAEKSITALVMVFAALVLLRVLHQELPAVLDRGAELGAHHTGWKPRFWLDGWIGGNATDAEID